jgi:hypothetical protein
LEILQEGERIAPESRQGFGQNQVYLSDLDVLNHTIEFIAVFEIGTGFSLCIDASKLLFGVSLDGLGIILNL